MPTVPSSTVLDVLSRMMRDAVIGVDTQDHVDLWNPAAERMLGWSESGSLGRPMPASIDLALYLPPGLEPTSGRERVRAHTKNGEWLEVDVYISRRDPAVLGSGWLFVSFDRTDENRVELEREELIALAKSEGRYRELLEAAPDGIIEVDREGYIVVCNAVTESLFGYSRRELLGMSVDDLIPDAARGRHAQHRANYCA